MRRFLIVLSLIIFTTDSAFATCDAGYSEQTIEIPRDCASTYGWKNLDGSGYNSSNLSNGEWSATFSDGRVLNGTSRCNSTNGGTYGGLSDNVSANGTGNHCWCKITSLDGIALTSQWVYFRELSDYDFRCANHCANVCSNRWSYGLAMDQDTTCYELSGIFAPSVSSQTTCVACPSKPANSSWTSGCNWVCDARYSQSGDSCTACSKPDNSSWTSSTGCEYACDSGYYYGSLTTTVTFPTSNGTGSTYNGSSRTWSVTWSNDTASGQSACATSSTGSPKASVSNSTSSSAKYCWCKVTNWNSNSLSSKWIYIANRSSGSTCRGTGTSGCAYYCSNYMKTNSSYRSQMFATVTNPPSTTTTSCMSCPDNGTSTAGATTITQCYLPANTNYSDSKGTYHYSSNCYYSN